MKFAKLAHDLRAPIARARTLAHLIEGGTPEEIAEYRRLLLEALDDAEELVKQLDYADRDPS